MSHSEEETSHSQSAVDAANDALDTLRISIDGDRPPIKPIVNGHRENGNTNGLDRVEQLENELKRALQDKETLADQYRSLVSRLNTMKTTLGNKLRQDAEELDRREQAIQQLTAQNEDMSSTIETLQQEIITSNAEAEQASRELEQMRNMAFEESAQESLIREQELREVQTELERCRIEKDDWEAAALESRAKLDDTRSSLESARRDLDLERQARQKGARELEGEREKCLNLQSVLEDFQRAKDHEIKQALRQSESQLSQLTQSLAEYKHRAHTAEMRIEETSTSRGRVEELEKSVKEKDAIIGKLRTETVIMNEHLMEALRRLRKNSQENNVDRRLVTNILLQFITTPRTDGKRFEMLNLLASILSWTDVEQEKAGLQRQGSSGGLFGRGSTSTRSNLAKEAEAEETESFSQMWVEFLLKESSAAGQPASSSSTSTSSTSPATPRRSTSSMPQSPTFGTPPPRKQMRLPSLGVVASTPNLALPPPGKKSPPS